MNFPIEVIVILLFVAAVIFFFVIGVFCACIKQEVSQRILIRKAQRYRRQMSMDLWNSHEDTMTPPPYIYQDYQPNIDFLQYDGAYNAAFENVIASEQNHQNLNEEERRRELNDPMTDNNQSLESYEMTGYSVVGNNDHSATADRHKEY